MVDLFGKSVDCLKSKTLFFFDMDGTIYSENRLYDGALELFENIRSKNGYFVFITNNSSKSVENYINKLLKMNIPVTQDNFFTSSQVTAIFLRENYINERIFCVGTRAFVNEMIKSGLNVTDEFDEDCTCLIVGFDTELNYKKLKFACKLLYKGVPYYATNIDKACPTDFGFIPDCGAICEAIYFATGKRPTFLGKPNPIIVTHKMVELNVEKNEAVVIGDRLYTDIACGVNAGVTTIGVLTGEMQLNDITDNCDNDIPRPDFLFKNILEINNAIFSAG